MKVLYSIQNLLYILLLSLSHYPTVYGCWIASVVKACGKVLVNGRWYYGHCYYGHLIVSSMEIMRCNLCQAAR